MAPKPPPEPEPWRYEDLPVYTYVDCGALGHNWDLVDSLHWVPAWGEPVTFRCMRCGMERRQMFKRGTDQALGKPRYIQPPGYKFAVGERPRRVDFLLMMIDETRRKRVRRRTHITHTEVSDGRRDP